jgi:carbon monoxide dehydrogenase subunit G
MLGRITVNLVFPTSAPPEAVWAALESPQRWPEVQYDLIKACIEPDGLLRAGATMRTWARPGTAAVDMSYRVVDAQKPSRLAIEVGGATFHFRGRTEYFIEADGAGSRVTIKSDIEPVLWLHKITTALARGWYTALMTANMRARIQPALTLAERIANE